MASQESCSSTLKDAVNHAARVQSSSKSLLLANKVFKECH